MIKVLLGGDEDHKVLILGLTRENLNQLTHGRPIAIEMDQFGQPELRLAICFGETPNDIITDINQQMGVQVPYLPDPDPGEEIRVQTPGKPGL